VRRPQRNLCGTVDGGRPQRIIPRAQSKRTAIFAVLLLGAQSPGVGLVNCFPTQQPATNEPCYYSGREHCQHRERMVHIGHQSSPESNCCFHEQNQSYTTEPECQGRREPGSWMMELDQNRERRSEYRDHHTRNSQQKQVKPCPNPQGIVQLSQTRQRKWSTSRPQT
jgi:hypothetical protein